MGTVSLSFQINDIVLLKYNKGLLMEWNTTSRPILKYVRTKFISYLILYSHDSISK